MRRELQEAVMELARRRGFFWPSFEIYGGLRGFYTYGNLGTKLKRNIEEAWRGYFVEPHGFLELDTPVLNPLRVFKASGHLEHFKDVMVECCRCHRVFRADHLIEEAVGLEYVEAMGEEIIKRLLRERGMRCPECGGELSEPQEFLTMFQTQIGPMGGERGFARPEAAQGMFLNFKLGFYHARERLPFALAQIGKVMRNEISPRRGLLRLREFTIMELELFFDPQDPSCPWFDEISQDQVSLITEEMEAEGIKKALKVTLREAVEDGYIKTEWQAYFMGVSTRFLTHLGVPPERQRFRAHLPEERSHYSTQTYDHEIYLESWGWIEVAGHAYRTDYDLKAHQEVSGVDMTIHRPDGSRFLPHVVEPSFGLDRLVYVTLEAAYSKRGERTVLSLPRWIAPIQAVVLPLVTRDGLPERAKEIRELLKGGGLVVEYEDKGSIGKRYARHDEIGTPVAVTVDYQTLEDDSVTLRDRDSWRQVRQKVSRLPGLLTDYLRGRIEFEELGSPI
jgi:glycyl-tRNA synthetase